MKLMNASKAHLEKHCLFNLSYNCKDAMPLTF